MGVVCSKIVFSKSGKYDLTNENHYDGEEYRT